MNVRTLIINTVLALAPGATAADLNIEITDIPSPTGTVNWSLFDSARAYDSDKQPVMTARNRVDGDSLKLTLHGLAPGTYAIKLFHDANGNGQLDTNAVGMPVEGYGFSNNAGHFGPAVFADAAVRVEADTHIAVKVR